MMYDWIKLFSKFFDMDLTWKVVTSHQKHAKFKKNLIQNFSNSLWSKISSICSQNILTWPPTFVLLVTTCHNFFISTPIHTSFEALNSYFFLYSNGYVDCFKMTSESASKFSSKLELASLNLQPSCNFSLFLFSLVYVLCLASILLLKQDQTSKFTAIKRNKMDVMQF